MFIPWIWVLIRILPLVNSAPRYDPYFFYSHFIAHPPPVLKDDASEEDYQVQDPNSSSLSSFSSSSSSTPLAPSPYFNAADFQEIIPGFKLDQDLKSPGLQRILAGYQLIQHYYPGENFPQQYDQMRNPEKFEESEKPKENVVKGEFRSKSVLKNNSKPSKSAAGDKPSGLEEYSDYYDSIDKAQKNDTGIEARFLAGLGDYSDYYDSSDKAKEKNGTGIGQRFLGFGLKLAAGIGTNLLFNDNTIRKETIIKHDDDEVNRLKMQLEMQRELERRKNEEERQKLQYELQRARDEKEINDRVKASAALEIKLELERKERERNDQEISDLKMIMELQNIKNTRKSESKRLLSLEKKEKEIAIKEKEDLKHKLLLESIGHLKENVELKQKLMEGLLSMKQGVINNQASQTSQNNVVIISPQSFMQRKQVQEHRRETQTENIDPVKKKPSGAASVSVTAN